MPIRKFENTDLQPLADIVRATAVFRPEEIEVAIELMQIAIDDPLQQDYILFTYVDEQGSVLGYYCAGRTPMTVSTFDLYWIAAHPDHHGKGIGYRLMKHCEEMVRSSGGTLVIVETSSLPKYDRTRYFYQRNNYVEAARVRDYYAAGDDLVVYTKHL
jgi:GNAT superfamily N-acetyltransferase